jgi:hypothetical protein
MILMSPVFKCGISSCSEVLFAALYLLSRSWYENRDRVSIEMPLQSQVLNQVIVFQL